MPVYDMICAKWGKMQGIPLKSKGIPCVLCGVIRGLFKYRYQKFVVRLLLAIQV